MGILFTFAFAAPVLAKPPGDARDPDVGKMLYKFNVIAMPQDDWSADDSDCGNKGRRIFFHRGSGNTLGTIQWNLDLGLNQDFRIADCDGTHDDWAAVDVSQSLQFYVMIRILGPHNSSLDLTCTEVYDSIGTDDLCLIGTENFTKNGTTKIMENVVDLENEDVLWSLSGDWRIFEVRIYEKL